MSVIAVSEASVSGIPSPAPNATGSWFLQNLSKSASAISCYYSPMMYKCQAISANSSEVLLTTNSGRNYDAFTVPSDFSLYSLSCSSS